MAQPNGNNSNGDGGMHFSPFAGFQAVRADPTTSPSGGAKNSASNASHMSWSETMNGATDIRSFSGHRDTTQGGSMMRLASSPMCLERSLLTQISPPPSVNVAHGRPADAAFAAQAGMLRMDNCPNFSISSPMVPPPQQTPPPRPHHHQWAPLPNRMATQAEGKVLGPRLYTEVPSNAVLIRVADATGKVVFCVPSEYGSYVGCPPPQPPARVQAQQATVPAPSPLQAPSPSSTPSGLPTHRVCAPGVTVGPSAASSVPRSAYPPSSQAPVPSSRSVEATATTASTTTTRDGVSSTSHEDAMADEDFEYEPYNSNTLLQRRVGSLDRVRCQLHGKERSAQNMVMVRSKRTFEVFWRCKHSSQCRAGTSDFGEPLPNPRGLSPRMSVADAPSLLTSTLVDAPLQSVPSPTWAVLPPAGQTYGLTSPTAASYMPERVIFSPPQGVSFAPDQVGYASPHPQPYASDAVFSTSYGQVSPQQRTTLTEGDVVHINGVQYRVVRVDSSHNSQ